MKMSNSSSLRIDPWLVIGLRMDFVLLITTVMSGSSVSFQSTLLSIYLVRT